MQLIRRTRKGSCRSPYTEIERGGGGGKDGKGVQHHRISSLFSLSSDSAPSLLVALLVYLTIPHGITRAPCAMYHFDVYHSCNRVLELASHIIPIVSGRGPSQNGRVLPQLRWCVNRVQRLHRRLRGFPLLCRSRSARRWKRMPIVSLEIVDTTSQLVSQKIYSVYVSHRIYDFLQRTFIQDMEPFIRSDL
jgi:hypothetical protein